MFNESGYYWYAAYVRYQHERSVWDFFRATGIETFLPFRQKLIRRTGSFRMAEVPMFDGYVFVRISYREHRFVLSHPSVIKLVSAEGKPSRIPDHQISVLKEIMNLSLPAEPASCRFARGEKVLISCGPLAGYQGLVRDTTNRNKVILLLEQIGCSLSIDMANLLIPHENICFNR
jgi:transcription antitermination factor NusG